MPNESVTGYFYKVSTRLLATNVRECAFGSIRTDKCSLCGEQESTEHIFTCEGRRETIRNKAMQAVERCYKIFNKNSELIAMAKTIARNTWNLDAARGFIPMEMIDFWKLNPNLNMKELENLGFQFIRAGHEIWKERCKSNQVEKQKTLPMEYMERPKLETRPSLEEICQEASKIVSKFKWRTVFKMMAG